MARSRSNSSSSSSSSDSSSSSGKHGKTKLKKQDKDKKKHNKGSDKQKEFAHPSLPGTGAGMPPSFLGMPLMPSFAQGAQTRAPSFPSVPPTTAPGNNTNMFQQFPQPSHEQSRGFDPQQQQQQHIGSPQPQQQQPGAYTQRAPPSGFRVPLSTDAPFPHEAQIGSAPFRDADGVSPVYVGSALFASSVHPCKVAPSLHPTPCRVPYGGGEFEHKGRYDLLPITNDMEWVRASHGDIPAGRQPVEGGYEENGGKLYHALVVVDGVRVPGKCGKHLGGAHVAFGGQERFSNDYEVLCWK